MSTHEDNKKNNLRELLNEPGIAKARPLHQPADGALLTLEITQVLPYDRNPRKTKNPKYDDIKSSIQARGVEHPIKVTQRPGTPPHQFMISGGGNTRLAILHELFEETGDPRFQSHQFIYEVWTSESNNVIAHLIENSERGEISLIDKARAIFDAKSLLEEETETSYTNRKLADALKATGLTSVDRTLINAYAFAVETLYPAIPDLLDQGLGRPQINRINKLLDAAEQLWSHHWPDDGEFRPLFLELLSRQNHAELYDGWQDQLHIDVVRELAQGDRDDFEKIRLQLDHLVQHGKLLLPEEAATQSPIPPVTKSVKKKSANAEPPSTPETPVHVEQAPDIESPQTPSTTDLEKDDTPSPNGTPIKTGPVTIPPDTTEPGKQLDFKPGTFQAMYLANEGDITKATPEDPHIDTMRTSIFDMAHTLATLMFSAPDDANVIVSLDNGAGFFLLEFPTLANTDQEPIYSNIEISRPQHNDHLNIRTANCVDFLLNISEQFSSTATAVIEQSSLYPENTLLARYHHTTLFRLPPDEDEPQELVAWRTRFDQRRHNSLTFSFYNLSEEESDHAARLMKSLMHQYHHLTVAQYLHTGTLPLWIMMEGQS